MSMPSSSELVATTAGRQPGLELGLRPGALRAAHRAVVRPRQDGRRVAGCRCRRRCPTAPGTAAARSVAGVRHVLARALGPDLVHPGGEPFRAAPGVGEHQRRAVLGDQVDDALLDVRPDRRPGQRAGRGAGQVEVVGSDARVPRRSDRSGTGHDDVDHDLLGRRRLDDDDGTPAVLRASGRHPGTRRPRRPAGRWRTARSAGPDPGRRAVEQRVEPFERHGEVRAALGAGDRVDLVDDHRPDARQPGPGAGREHQVERLGRRDEDVRRLRREGPALVRRGVAGADADRDVGQRPAPAGWPPAGCRPAASAGSARRRWRAP